MPSTSILHQMKEIHWECFRRVSVYKQDHLAWYGNLSNVYYSFILTNCKDTVVLHNKDKSAQQQNLEPISQPMWSQFHSQCGLKHSSSVLYEC